MYLSITEYLPSYKKPSKSTFPETPSFPSIKGVVDYEKKVNFSNINSLSTPPTPSLSTISLKKEGYNNEGDNKDNNEEIEYTLEYETGNVNTFNPQIWGPSYWFNLHISATYYPLSASPIVKDRMKGRILAIPYEIPCAKCRGHAIAFIEKHRDKLDTIVSGRHELGRFYVDFHNQVNKRYGKKEWTYEEAYKLYSGGINITYLK